MFGEMYGTKGRYTVIHWFISFQVSYEVSYFIHFDNSLSDSISHTSKLLHFLLVLF